ncbi:MAG: hypothetical protein AAFY81_08415, partial [Pseudomonadota bacterium]
MGTLPFKPGAGSIINSEKGTKAWQPPLSQPNTAATAPTNAATAVINTAQMRPRIMLPIKLMVSFLW